MWVKIRQTVRKDFRSEEGVRSFIDRTDWEWTSTSVIPDRGNGELLSCFLERKPLRRVADLEPRDEIIAVIGGEPPSIRLCVRRSEMVDARREEEVFKEFPEEIWEIVSQTPCPNAGKAGFSRFFLEGEFEIWAGELKVGDFILANLGPAEPQASKL